MKKRITHPGILFLLSIVLIFLFMHISNPKNFFQNGVAGQPLEKIRFYLIVRLAVYIVLTLFLIFSGIGYAKCVQAYSEKWADDTGWRALVFRNSYRFGRFDPDMLGKGRLPVYALIIMLTVIFSAVYPSLLRYDNGVFSDIKAVYNISKDMDSKPVKVNCILCKSNGRSIKLMINDNGSTREYNDYITGSSVDYSNADAVADKIYGGSYSLVGKENKVFVEYYPFSHMVKTIKISEDT